MTTLGATFVLLRIEELFRRSYLKFLKLLFTETIPISFYNLKLYIFSDGFGSIEENIFDNIYFTDEEIRNAETIIDLGAHHGSFTVWAILKSSPGSTIIAVEPNPLAVKLCLQNIKLLRDIISIKKLMVKVINAAVWDSRGMASLQNVYWSEGAYISDEVSGRFKVKTFTLNDILKNSNGRTVVKIDIEGAEYRVLNKAELEKIDRISLEVHDNAKQIMNLLMDKGFKTLVCTYPITKSFTVMWLKINPKKYSSLIALYRLMVSQIAKPRITIIKGFRT